MKKKNPVYTDNLETLYHAMPGAAPQVCSLNAEGRRLEAHDV